MIGKIETLIWGNRLSMNIQKSVIRKYAVRSIISGFID